MRPRVYVAGPYSFPDPEVNVRRAIEAANQLIDAGFNPYVPHMTHWLHLAQPQPYELWLELDLEWLRVCAAVLRLPGESPGADRECHYARSLGRPVFTDLATLTACFKGKEA